LAVEKIGNRFRIPSAVLETGKWQSHPLSIARADVIIATAN
jgi:hypothetical protein